MRPPLVRLLPIPIHSNPMQGGPTPLYPQFSVSSALLFCLIDEFLAFPTDDFLPPASLAGNDFNHVFNFPFVFHLFLFAAALVTRHVRKFAPLLHFQLH